MAQPRMIYGEQAPSLARALLDRGIRHGDVVHNVVMKKVGFFNFASPCGPAISFAFCPMTIESTGKIFEANLFKRWRAFPDSILWTPDAVLKLQQTTPSGRGFASILCSVASNGAIHLSNAHILDVELAPEQLAVNRAGAYEIFHSLGPCRA